MAFRTAGASDDPELRRRYGFVLDRTSLEEMWRPRVEVSADLATGRSESMGLSFFRVRDGDRSVIGHAGSQAGFRAFLYFQPVKRTAVILVFNTANEVGETGVRLAFERMIRAAYEVADPLE